jgi:hypothetical protein
MTTVRPYQRHRSRAKAARATAPGLITGIIATIALSAATIVTPEATSKLPALVAALLSLLQAIATFIATIKGDKRRHS